MLAVALWAGPAHAQFSGTLGAVSDYRYRGVSLSDDRPAVQGSLVYDDPIGWYAGVFASSIRFPDQGGSGVQAIPFLGYATRVESGWSFEAGANATIARGSYDYDYQEFYGGFAFRNVSGRVYWSPRYYGQAAYAIYGELNAALPLNDAVKLLGHAGVLSRDRPSNYAPRPDALYDLQAGIGVDFDGLNVQLSLVGLFPAKPAYTVVSGSRRNTVVLGISRAF